MTTVADFQARLESMTEVIAIEDIEARLSELTTTVIDSMRLEIPGLVAMGLRLNEGSDTWHIYHYASRHHACHQIWQVVNKPGSDGEAFLKRLTDYRATYTRENRTAEFTMNDYRGWLDSERVLAFLRCNLRL